MSCMRNFQNDGDIYPKLLLDVRVFYEIFLAMRHVYLVIFF